MRRRLRFLSLWVAIAAVLTWIALGANRGWTRTSVAVKTLDEVTGIEGLEYRKQFVPGLDMLGAVLAGAAFLAAGTLCFRKTSNG